MLVGMTRLVPIPEVEETLESWKKKKEMKKKIPEEKPKKKKKGKCKR